MKFSKQIIIDLPREEVFKKVEDPTNFKHWQKGFISYRHLSGKPGQEGSRAKLKYKMGKREISMIETIIKRAVPGKLHVSYEATGVFNIQKNYFQEEEKTRTLWIADYEFKFSGFMKLMGFFMPGAFKKQSLTYMKDFKNFAENGNRVNEYGKTN
ncbi:SRPBCC family protein [Antarcticibacterium flavum]|uniref:SRPBCC family protein n=1 Tax=Antarcticibacterium flavum TaxID=2058175 RepID=A0A5B7X5U0_9FLAO|nr:MULTISPECIES: SRPBCC family protein [Antarcticibacterium]MCM4159960.1 SRPBCC family protein [Antarcticibacterium sp. W02-3]QCY70445.1 SRPBCC family protein [Antarcticibacterium flavum]